MSDAIDDMEAYSRLTDNVFFTILNSTSEELKPAREILNNILCRKLYKSVCQLQLDQKNMLKEVTNASCTLTRKIVTI